MISYDDFQKLEITIGEIKTAEIVVDADKLLRLTVDFGEVGEDGTPLHRQIVSGIRAFFPDPEALVGKRCPFLTNLEPRTIRGLVSNGMILAASSTEAFALLVPHQTVPVGTRIK